jgi:hypothetical protein
VQTASIVSPYGNAAAAAGAAAGHAPDAIGWIQSVADFTRAPSRHVCQLHVAAVHVIDIIAKR